MKGYRETEIRAGEILDRLEHCYPEAHVELDFDGPLQLLIATILSAQSTDKRVNQVTPGLFRKYPDANAFVAAARDELEEELHSTGFFRQKAKSVQSCCAKLVELHGGKVPCGMDELTALPGVGRKTANVVRVGAFGLPGIAVDTHCRRVSQRLGLTTESDPVKIERRLGELIPEGRWADISRLYIWHGRYTCKARGPACDRCGLVDLCPWPADQARAV